MSAVDEIELLHLFAPHLRLEPDCSAQGAECACEEEAYLFLTLQETA